MKKIMFLFLILLILGMGVAYFIIRPASVKPQPAAHVMSLKVTAELQSEHSIIKATHSPVSFASWLGYLIFLSDEGEVLWAHPGGSQLTSSLSGTYHDILGLMMKDHLPMFLTLSAEDRRLMAFIEGDNQSFRQMIVSEEQAAIYQGFCSGVTEHKFWVRGEGRKLYEFSFDVVDKTIFNLKSERTLSLPFDISDCFISQAGELYISAEDGTFAFMDGKWMDQTVPQGFKSQFIVSDMTTDHETEEFFTGTNMFWGATDQGVAQISPRSDEAIIDVKIVDGLSIRGLDEAQLLAVITDNMGSVYASGLLIFTSPTDRRIILVSLDYANRQAHISQLPQN